MDFDELEMDITYQVTNMIFINTEETSKIMVDLDNQFSVYLPKEANNFWNNNHDLFNRMVQVARRKRLGLRCVRGELFNRVEFIKI